MTDFDDSANENDPFGIEVLNMPALADGGLHGHSISFSDISDSEDDADHESEDMEVIDLITDSDCDGDVIMLDSEVVNLVSDSDSDGDVIMLDSEIINLVTDSDCETDSDDEWEEWIELWDQDYIEDCDAGYDRDVSSCCSWDFRAFWPT